MALIGADSKPWDDDDDDEMSPENLKSSFGNVVVAQNCDNVDDVSSSIKRVVAGSTNSGIVVVVSDSSTNLESVENSRSSTDKVLAASGVSGRVAVSLKEATVSGEKGVDLFIETCVPVRALAELSNEKSSASIETEVASDGAV